MDATSPVISSGQHPPVMEQKGAAAVPSVDAEKAGQTPARPSPKHITAPSPPHFLPLPAAAVTVTTATTDTGRRKGRALSESDDSQGGSSWMDSNLPAT